MVAAAPPGPWAAPPEDAGSQSPRHGDGPETGDEATDTFRLIYKSTACFERAAMLEPRNLPALLLSARCRNAELGITGVLIYTGARFLQVLEGRRGAVTHVFERLLVDRRHRSVSVIEMGEAEGRHFAGWSMGFLGTSRGVEAKLDAAAGTIAGLETDPARRMDLLRTTLLLIADAPISLLWRDRVSGEG